MKLCDFVPRPDNIPEHDQQKSCFESRDRLSIIMGGNGSGAKTLAIAKALKTILNDDHNGKFTFAVICDHFDDIKLRMVEMLHGNFEWGRNSLGVFNSTGCPWTIEFRSPWSIGGGSSFAGFLATGDIEWGIVLDAIRATREYEFPGMQIVEFNPIDSEPDHSLEVMEESGTIPGRWKIYHTSAKCALEAGHVSPQWFNTFMDTIPEWERDTRIWGAWPKAKS